MVLIHNENGLIVICKYKIIISNLIQKFITYDSQMEYGKRVNNLYECHNIIYKKGIMHYPVRSLLIIDAVIKQEFTIHHFIYYLIYEAVRIIKRRSKHFTEYDVYELIEDNMFHAYNCYAVPMFDKIHSLYNYMYPNKADIFDIIISALFKRLIQSPNNAITNFVALTKNDLMIHYTNDDCLIDFDFICNNIKYIDIYNQNHNDSNDVDFVEFYKQTVAKERLQIYEAELIETTWHPDRIMEWCFDNEEKNDNDWCVDNEEKNDIDDI